MGPLFRWLVVTDDVTAQKNLTIEAVTFSDRVTFLSTVLPGPKEIILLTKIDLMKPVFVGTWMVQTRSWYFNKTEIFAPFRGLFGKQLIVATLPVGTKQNVQRQL